MFITALVLNTMLFGLMAFNRLIFADDKERAWTIIFPVLYFPSLLVIVFFAPNLLVGILAAISMQFVVNQVLWGIITDIFQGAGLRKKHG